MKKILLASATALGLLLGLPSHAATTTGTFNVNITLTSVCTLGTITDVAFAYTSFQVAAATGTGGGFNVTCTPGLQYSMALTTTSTGLTADVTDDAVNLAYTLAVPAATQTGTGAAQPFTVTGNMNGGQAGSCATTTCTNAAATNRGKTLTVTY